MKICAFTGHRPQSLSFGFDETDRRCVRLKQILKNQIIKMIREEGVRYFITGMARGIDQFAAEIVLELKQSYPEIKLECAVPCRTQSAKWEKAARERYQNILAKCDQKTVLQENHTKDCMQKRNRYMVVPTCFLPSGTVRRAEREAPSGTPWSREKRFIK